MKIIIKRSKEKQWHFVFVARNGRIMCSQENVKNFRDCQKTIVSIIGAIKSNKYSINVDINAVGRERRDK